jgi:hypothetical protein
MGRYLLGTVLLSALAAPCSAPAQIADALTTYFESSANQNPRSNAGVSVSGDRLRLKADVALRAPNDRTEIVPNLSSAFVLGKNLDIETRVNLAEWNTGTDASFDTRLHIRSLGPFFDELEGRVRRSPDGLTSQLLRLGFYQIVGNATAVTPITLTGRAIYEVTRGAALSEEGRRLGFETRLAGFMSPFVPGAGALSLKVERVGGPRPGSQSTLAFDQRWTFRDMAQLGVNFKVLRATHSTANELEPSLDFTWHSQF